MGKKQKEVQGKEGREWGCRSRGTGLSWCELVSLLPAVCYLQIKL